MTNIFLAYSREDKMHLDTIIHNLTLTPSRHKLWYYNPHSKTSLAEALEVLKTSDLFILILSDNSLSSPSVQKELSQAIFLSQNKELKGLYSILIDNNINIKSDKRIPQYIRNSIYLALPPITASKVIKDIIEKY